MKMKIEVVPIRERWAKGVRAKIKIRLVLKMKRREGCGRGRWCG
jgi:hypothetical protein